MSLLEFAINCLSTCSKDGIQIVCLDLIPKILSGYLITCNVTGIFSLKEEHDPCTMLFAAPSMRIVNIVWFPLSRMCIL